MCVSVHTRTRTRTCQLAIARRKTHRAFWAGFWLLYRRMAIRNDRKNTHHTGFHVHTNNITGDCGYMKKLRKMQGNEQKAKADGELELGSTQVARKPVKLN